MHKPNLYFTHTGLRPDLLTGFSSLGTRKMFMSDLTAHPNRAELQSGISVINI